MGLTMRLVPQALRRAFWSLYGRLAWDAARPPSKAMQVGKIVDVLTARRVAPDEWVLDAGCGTGDYALALGYAGFHVIGVDYAEGMLTVARGKVTAQVADNISFRQSDLNRQLAFPAARFDHVINISVLQAVADPAQTLAELWRVLKPGGTLVLLHVPRPDFHNLPWYKAITHRVRALERKAPWRVALIAAKTWAERTGNTRFWTVEELRAMLEGSHFEVLTVSEGPPIVMVACRTES